VLNFLQSGSTGGDTDEYVARVRPNHHFKADSFWSVHLLEAAELSQDPFKTGLCVDRCAENTNSKSLRSAITSHQAPIPSSTSTPASAGFHYLRAPVNDSFDMTQEGLAGRPTTLLVPSIERTPYDSLLSARTIRWSVAAKGKAPSTTLNTSLMSHPR